jgi:hypothetical protein
LPLLIFHVGKGVDILSIELTVLLNECFKEKLPSKGWLLDACHLTLGTSNHSVMEPDSKLKITCALEIMGKIEKSKIINCRI